MHRKKKSKPSPKQMKIFVKYMRREDNDFLLNVTKKRERKIKWLNFTQELNDAGTGRSLKEWQVFWSVYKSNVKQNQVTRFGRFDTVEEDLADLILRSENTAQIDNVLESTRDTRVRWAGSSQDSSKTTPELFRKPGPKASVLRSSSETRRCTRSASTSQTVAETEPEPSSSGMARQRYDLKLRSEPSTSAQAYAEEALTESESESTQGDSDSRKECERSTESPQDPTPEPEPEPPFAMPEPQNANERKEILLDQFLSTVKEKEVSESHDVSSTDTPSCSGVSFSEPEHEFFRTPAQRKDVSNVEGPSCSGVSASELFPRPDTRKRRASSIDSSPDSMSEAGLESSPKPTPKHDVIKLRKDSEKSWALLTENALDPKPGTSRASIARRVPVADRPTVPVPVEQMVFKSEPVFEPEPEVESQPSEPQPTPEDEIENLPGPAPVSREPLICKLTRQSGSTSKIQSKEGEAEDSSTNESESKDSSQDYSNATERDTTEHDKREESNNRYVVVNQENVHERSLAVLTQILTLDQESFKLQFNKFEEQQKQNKIRNKNDSIMLSLITRKLQILERRAGQQSTKSVAKKQSQ